jgi:hypothetical protein
MRALRNYSLEFCWLILILALLMITPAKALLRAEGFNFDDFEGDCDQVSGWCIPDMQF